VAEGVGFVSELQGSFGLWEYTARPQASRWVTFDLLRSLLRLKGGEPEEWISLEPRTPFQAYPRRSKAIDSLLTQCRSAGWLFTWPSPS